MIIENDSIPLKVKIERLQDTEQIKAFMLAYFASSTILQEEEPS